MEDGGSVLTIVIMLVVFVLGLSSVGTEKTRKRKTMEDAKNAYESGLEDLKKVPNDPDLKGEVLRLGRHYSGLTRESKTVALFDEVALMNDINAATAAATAVGIPKRESQASVKARLDELSDLLSRGVVTKEEYKLGRERILSEL